MRMTLNASLGALHFVEMDILSDTENKQMEHASVSTEVVDG